MLRRLFKGLMLCLLVLLLGVVLAVLALRWVPPPTSAFMLEARAQELLDRGPAYRTEYLWRDLEHISPQAAIAVIASEDQQFPFHMGFDFKSIREAVRSNARGHHQRGASTISQQVAKNLFLWSGGGYFRKGLEAALTLLIETLWPKERILEVYLNIAQFGRGVYGVEAAARHFWHKPATRLTRADSALLAAVLPNPLRLRVDAPSNYVLRRQGEILGQIAGLGGTAYLDELEKPAAHR
ncbi:MAG TPA: monofunctional biosynthetic peptidoglycan transglycosylase [Steroidobacteraceae bacterium]|nr:monofunctional biosynthetic peptidoglycan transglycosylase [Steroidobacteraceae bacterium]